MARPTSPPAGHIYVGRAATLGRIDGSRVQHWCRVASTGRRPPFKAFKRLIDGHHRWVIERSSYQTWVRGR